MIKYRKGLAELREAVRVAISEGATDKDITDGKWFTYQKMEPTSALRVVATDEAVDTVIRIFTIVFQVALKSGGMVSFRGFGTFFVGTRGSFVMTGAASGISAYRKVGRFRQSRDLQKALAAVPFNNGLPVEPVV